MRIRSNTGGGSFLQHFRLPLKSIFLISFLLLIGMLCGCQSAAKHPDQVMNKSTINSESCRQCLSAYETHGWCKACQLGYVALVPIRSQKFHEALDVHGHEVPRSSLQCQLCIQVSQQDEFCPRCHHGFVSGKLYFSKLSWSLAQGITLSGNETCLDCDPSSENPASLQSPVSPCPTCDGYRVGNVKFLSAEKAHNAWSQLQRLLEALDRDAECPGCCLNGFFGIPCPDCGKAPIPQV